MRIRLAASHPACSFSRSNKPPLLCICIALALVRCAHAQVTCHPIPNPKYPGLEECTATVNITPVFAAPPEPQKMSRWCWAASLSAIFTFEGHPISQEQIVSQNFGVPIDAAGGDSVQFAQRLNRHYVDSSGHRFVSVATRIRSIEEAVDALSKGVPILYNTTYHATVQTSLKYRHAPGGPFVARDGRIWDPAPGAGYRHLSLNDVTSFAAAWAIRSH